MIIISKNCLVPECGGADHKWEFERPTLREFKRIQQATGMDVEAWAAGLNGVLTNGVTDAAIDATLVLIDILHRRIGVRVAFEDVDVDLGDLDFEFDDVEDQADKPEDGEGKDPAPTTVSLPPEEAPASTSGPDPEAESPPRSSPTPPTSGGFSASP